MKKIKNPMLLMSLVLALLISGCATSGNNAMRKNTNTGGITSIAVTQPNLSLTSYLRSVPGLDIAGEGRNARIIVRGVSSIGAGNFPLFYLDEMRIGRNYSDVVDMVNMHEVTRIDVIKGPELSAYGVEGSSGVIIINTRI